MRRLTLLSFALLAACELQPAPRQQAAPPAPTPPPTPVIEAAPADAGLPLDGPPQPQWSAGCRDVGIHIANVIIASTTDAATKSIYERDREQMIRSMAEACTTNGWSDAALKCYGKANNPADLKACETKYTPPKPRTRPEDEPQTRGSGAGSGSAAPARAGAGAGSAAPRPPRAGAGAGSAAPRPPRERPGSAAAKGSGAGSAAPRPGAGSGSARRP